MRKILAAKYKQYVLYLEIMALILLFPFAYNFMPLNKGTQTFYIPASDINTTVKTLEKNGYEVTALDKWLLGLKKVPNEGWYSLKPNKYGRFVFFYTLHKQKTDKLMDVVVFAGETKEELTARLANDMKLNQHKLMDIYEKFAIFEEANILAGRYTLARKAKEEASMEYLFLISDRRMEKFKKEYFELAPSIKELKKYFTIASIIQKESYINKEMPLIASVIYNRLAKKMKLQMDGTLNYGQYARTIVTPERIKNDTSPYNTYKHKGLPPHPLSTVSLTALKAAVNPPKTDYLFFMLNENGTHDFSVDYTKHLEKIRVYRAYQKAKKSKDENLTESNTTTVKKLFEEPTCGDFSIKIDWKKVKL